MPIALSVKGRYFRLAKFMHLLRLEAGVKNGKPHASGRLYGIDNVSLSTGDQGGLITATLALNAFVFGSAGAPPAPRPARRRRPRWPRRQQSDAEDRRTPARLAAKQRRQKILVGVLAGVLAVLLAYELPHLLGALQRQQLGGGARRPGASTPEPASVRGSPLAGGERRRSVRGQVAAER